MTDDSGGVGPRAAVGDDPAVMALIASFRRLNRTTGGFKTTVHCGWAVVSNGSERLLHLETYGSETRQIPDKVSQSLQLNAEGAKELRRLIDEAFPD